VDRAPLGLLVAALGATVLGLSVFAPWYGVSITSTGAAAAQQELVTLAQRYGSGTIQAEADGRGAKFGSLAGRQLATVTAHQAMRDVSLLLVLLAGVALLASLLRLADLRGLLFATGSQIALCGVLAAGVILFRMLFRPGAEPNAIALSLTWGAWLALLSAAAIIGGGVVAGNARSIMRARPKYGPGPPPIGTGPR
jgi:hypothetical protein